MSVQMVLLPVFVQVGLTFAFLFWTGGVRTKEFASRETQIGSSFNSQFQLPVLFYVLIAVALPLRRADLVIVLLSWVFVVTWFIQAGIFVTSNNAQPQRSLAWSAGVLVLLAMWVYFALKLLLAI